MKLKNLLSLAVVVLSQSISHYALAQITFPSFADLAEKLTPSVVNISTVHDKNYIENEDFNTENEIETTIESIFSMPHSGKVSLGSGFIISDDGYIVTNNHVIDGADIISVTLHDNTSAEARVVGRDTKTDIALIKIDVKSKLTPAKFGNSDNIRVGDWILAIGNPFGLGGSVTAGIVSAKSRDIDAGPYDNFIQTDASINQGSSGGPMFNLNGEVIGVNTAIFSTSGGNMGVGFAVPTNLIDFIVKELKEHGKVNRGWIGVKMQRNSADIAGSLGLSSNQGVIVSEVPETSSAAKAGIKAGDIILKFDGKITNSPQRLSQIVAETKIGKTSEIEIWRDNKKQTLKIIVEKMPEQQSPSKEKQFEIGTDNVQSQISILGLNLARIDDKIADKYKLSHKDIGIAVIGTVSGSDAALKGIKEGNIITQIDKKPVIDIDDIIHGVNEAVLDNNRPVLLQVKDGEQLFFVAVKLSPLPKDIKK